MSFARFFPNTRESANTIKQRGWRYQGILVVDPERDNLTWDQREIAKQIGVRLYGPRAPQSRQENR